MEAAAEDLQAVLSAPEEGRISWIGKRLARVEGILQRQPYRGDPLAGELLEMIHAYR